MAGILRVVTSVGLATILYKSLAAAQQLLIARALGATKSADAFFLAQVIPVLLGGLLFSAFSTSALFVLKDRDDQRAISGLLLSALGFLTALAGFVWLTGGLLLRLLAPGTEPGLVEEATAVQLLLLPVLIFQPVGGLLAGVLLAKGRLLAPPLSVCLMYVSGLAGLAFTRDGSARCLAIGLSIGAILQVAALLAVYGRGSLTWPVLDTRCLRELTGQALPTLGCNAISTWFLIADRSFATNFGIGQLAAISYVYSLITMPTQIVVNTVVGVCMPRWVSARKNPGAFSESITRALSLLLCAVAPITILVGIGAGPVTALALGQTRFAPDQISATASMLAAYSPTILAFAAKDALTAAALAQGRPGTAFGIGITGVVTAIALKVLLAPVMGLRAAPIGTGIGLGLCGVLLLWKLLPWETVRNCWTYSRETLLASATTFGLGGLAVMFVPIRQSWMVPCVVLLCYATAWISFGGIASGQRLVRGRW